MAKILIIVSANALGLFETERPTETVAYGKLIQGFNRFILEQLYRELTNNDKVKVTALEQLFGFQMRSVTRCQCSHEQERDICPFVVDLIYSKPVRKCEDIFKTLLSP